MCTWHRCDAVFCSNALEHLFVAEANVIMLVSRPRLLCCGAYPYSRVLALATVLNKAPNCLYPHVNCVAVDNIHDKADACMLQCTTDLYIPQLQYDTG